MSAPYDELQITKNRMKPAMNDSEIVIGDDTLLENEYVDVGREDPSEMSASQREIDLRLGEMQLSGAKSTVDESWTDMATSTSTSVSSSRFADRSKTAAKSSAAESSAAPAPVIPTVDAQVPPEPEVSPGPAPRDEPGYGSASSAMGGSVPEDLLIDAMVKQVQVVFGQFDHLTVEAALRKMEFDIERTVNFLAENPNFTHKPEPEKEKQKETLPAAAAAAAAAAPTQIHATAVATKQSKGKDIVRESDDSEMNASLVRAHHHVSTQRPAQSQRSNNDAPISPRSYRLILEAMEEADRQKQDEETQRVIRMLQEEDQLQETGMLAEEAASLRLAEELQRKELELAEKERADQELMTYRLIQEEAAQNLRAVDADRKEAEELQRRELEEREREALESDNKLHRMLMEEQVQSLELEQQTQRLIDDAARENMRTRGVELPEGGPSAMVCGICAEDKMMREMHVLCTCKHTYCLECMCSYFTMSMESSPVIVCPEPECKRPLLPDEIKVVLQLSGNLPLFERYTNLALNHHLAQRTDVRYCPMKECNTPVIGDPNDPIPMLACPKCRARFCFHCKDFWHPGLTCEQFQKQVADNDPDLRELRNWIEKNDCHKCPKCAMIIQRTEGCDHMKCRSCQYEFCWVCSDAWSKSHHLCKLKGKLNNIFFGSGGPAGPAGPADAGGSNN